MPQTGFQLGIVETFQAGSHLRDRTEGRETPFLVSPVLLQELADEPIEDFSILGSQGALTQENVGQRARFVLYPRIEASDQSFPRYEVILQSDNAEKQVAIGLGEELAVVSLSKVAVIKQVIMESHKHPISSLAFCRNGLLCTGSFVESHIWMWSSWPR